MFYMISAKRKLKLPHYTYTTQHIVPTVCATSFLVTLNSRQHMREFIHSSTMQGPINLHDVQARSFPIMQFGEHDSVGSTKHDGTINSVSLCISL
jgi:hypothetical protein